MTDQSLNLLDKIREEHRFLTKRLNLLKIEMRKLGAGEAPDYHLLGLLLKFFKSFPDEIHHAKEDYLYDALIRNGVLESDYLRRLKAEHEKMGNLTAGFERDLSYAIERDREPGPNVIEKIVKYIELQELHMSDEESQFLPVAEAMLPEARLNEINEAIQRDLITLAAQERFAKLQELDNSIEKHLGNDKGRA